MEISQMAINACNFSICFKGGLIIFVSQKKMSFFRSIMAGGAISAIMIFGEWDMATPTPSSIL
jgi:hypothetical protein